MPTMAPTETRRTNERLALIGRRRGVGSTMLRELRLHVHLLSPGRHSVCYQRLIYWQARFDDG